MTVKRAVLIGLTVCAIALIGWDLLASWSQPQFQSRLELYQTNLVLEASTWQGEETDNLTSAKKALITGDSIKTATEQYQEFRQSVEKNLARSQTLLAKSPGDETLKTSSQKAEQLLPELDLHLGLLQAEQNQIEAAQKTWAGVIQQTPQPRLEPLSKTADVLAGLWSEPPRLLPDAEPRLQKNLDGWFRYRALTQLYQLQQRSDALVNLQIEQQAAAQRALVSLTIVGGVPTLASAIGVVILLILLGQWVLQRKQALLSPATMAAWTVPWNGEIVWQVLIFGFFLVGQGVSRFLMPILILSVQLVSGVGVTSLPESIKAFYTLLQYVLIAAGSLGVLYWSIAPHLPLPEGWFQLRWRSNWLLWGVGGYFAALPLVILVSLINQKIWQGQGGSNPILSIVLEGKDNLALTIFFVTAAVAAPIFEEALFRGFLLPSLTRYLPLWGAIVVSSLIFAVAHLSLSEVLPLTILGMVLGFVYSRSRNLLSSMLLHGLWNSGTLLSLIVLGSAKG